MKVRIKDAADRPRHPSKEKQDEPERRRPKEKPKAEMPKSERTGPYDDPHRRPA